jgi:hypothetical protein
MKIVPQLLILTLSILVFSASAQTPQPARRNGKAPKLLKIEGGQAMGMGIYLH